MHITEEQKLKALSIAKNIFNKTIHVLKSTILFLLNINIKSSTWLYNFLNK